MARLNVYVPDELAERARTAGLNVSALARAAITRELSLRATDGWLAGVPKPRRSVSHEAALAALEQARTELDTDA
jgi:post-segregation antitoxin (ccd killing protein)